MTTKLAPGQVRDAIVNHLASTGRASTIAQIRMAVREELGEAVPDSSIRSYLALDKRGLFKRTGRGVYILRKNNRDAELFQSVKKSYAPAYSTGKAKLYHANCLEWLDNQPSCSIHAVLTDPPYGLIEYTEKQKEKLRNGRGGVWRLPPSFDGNERSPLPRFTVLNDRDLARLHQFFHDWATSLLPVLVPGANVVVASNPLLSYLVADAMVQAGLERRGELVRLVMTMRGGDRPKNAHDEFSDVSVMPRSMWEPWLLFRKPLEGRVQDNLRKWGTGGFRRRSADQPFGDVIRSSPTHKREKEVAPHPSLKPQKFLRELAQGVLPLGKGVVLDPFAGSGSTLAACERVGIESCGVESDTIFVKLAKKSIVPLRDFDT